MKKLMVFICFLISLTACISQNGFIQTNQKLESMAEQNAVTSNLPDFGEAPELTNEIWVNSDEPLRLSNLRGRVVLLDMWTFG